MSSSTSRPVTSYRHFSGLSFCSLLNISSASALTWQGYQEICAIVYRNLEVTDNAQEAFDILRWSRNHHGIPYMWGRPENAKWRWHVIASTQYFIAAKGCRKAKHRNRWGGYNAMNCRKHYWGLGAHMIILGIIINLDYPWVRTPLSKTMVILVCMSSL
jgi:hypothetical protein